VVTLTRESADSVDCAWYLHPDRARARSALWQGETHCTVRWIPFRRKIRDAEKIAAYPRSVLPGRKHVSL